MNHRPVADLLLALAALCFAPVGWAQYKVVDANGRVTYTDRPALAAGTKTEPVRPSGGTASATSNLPFELRQLAERYPVTLFSTEPCDACAAGRNLLRQRGIPFAEKTVRTESDRRAFQAAEASNELPVLRLGAQQLRGFNDTEWTSYLDAAGYPKQSRLPPSYQAPEAAPLVAERPAAARAAAGPTPAQAPAALPPALETAPNGIRF